MDVDVAVVGAGLAGTAVLRELARRHARVVLFDAHDLAWAGSAAALGTIDTADLTLDPFTDAALELARTERERETGVALLTAPHLASRVPVLSLARSRERGRTMLARWDARLALRARDGAVADRTVIDGAAARAREPALRVDDDRGVLLASRVRLDAHRLALSWARDAEENGAEIALGSEVTAIEPQTGGVRLTIRGRDGATRTVSARAVALAIGAWPVPGGATQRARDRRLHLVLEHAVAQHALVLETGESLVPFHGVSVITSAAAPHAGAPSDTRVTTAEVRALVSRVAAHSPDVRDVRVVDTYPSIRRLVAADVAPPVYEVPHGRPWDARARGEEVALRIAKALGIGAASTAVTTSHARVPGGEEVTDSFLVAERLSVPEATARRLALRHGARCLEIGNRLAKQRVESAVVCACEPVLEAEVRHAVRAEHAATPSDVARRTRLGLGPCGGMRCAQRAAQIVCDERGLPPHEAHAMTARFLTERWRARSPALDAELLAQEELALARWTAAGLGVEDEEPPRG